MNSLELFRKTRLHLIYIIFAAFFLLSSPGLKVYGASITVNATCSLANAIIAANTDTATGGCTAGTAGSDTITITAAGTSSGVITLSSQLTIQGTSSQRSIIVIEGGNYTISGNDSTRIFLVQGRGRLTLNNLTITNGYADAGGAIKVNSGGALSVNNSTIQNSEAHATDGGGIMCDSCTGSVTNSVIANNDATDDGGGLYSSGTLTVTSSIVRNNTAVDDGGGIYVSTPSASTSVTIKRSSLSGNSATGTNGQGGAIYSSGAIGLVSIANSTIYDNRARAGAAFFQFQGTSNLTHVTMVYNRPVGNRGALRAALGTVRLRNSIIAGTTSDGSTRVRDCRTDVDLAQNRNNLVEDGSCSAAYSGDPVLASSTEGSPPYYPLLETSPLIGQGWAAHCAEVGTDQRGQARPATGCDLGAYEHVREDPVPTATLTFTAAPPTDTPIPPTDTPIPTADTTRRYRRTHFHHRARRNCQRMLQSRPLRHRRHPRQRCKYRMLPCSALQGRCRRRGDRRRRRHSLSLPACCSMLKVIGYGLVMAWAAAFSSSLSAQAESASHQCSIWISSMR